MSSKKAIGKKVVETRNALITVERDGVCTLVTYSRKPPRNDPNQLSMF